MPSKLQVTIVEITDQPDHGAPSKSNEVFKQTFDTLDLPTVVLALNKKPRAKRAFNKIAKTASA
jgi:hypothetical protein